MTLASTEPVVSVVIPTLNEERHVEALLDSLFAQDVPDHMEILVVDGGSTDATRALVTSLAERSPANRTVKLLANPQTRTPFAFNIGLKHAQAPLVAIFGAHAVYPPNYVSSCLATIANAKGPAAAGGLIETLAANDSLPARLVAAVMTNTFASSRSSFRTQTAGEVDNIPFPIIPRQIALDVGGYDERLLRNQDNDMNERLRRSGVTLLITDATRASYFTVSTPKKLLRYAWRNGWWNAMTLRLRGTGMRARHLFPAAFATGVIVSSIASVLPLGWITQLARRGLSAVVVLHLGTGVVTTVRENDQIHGLEVAAVPPIIFAFHAAYGLGTIAGLFAKKDASDIAVQR